MLTRSEKVGWGMVAISAIIIIWLLLRKMGMTSAAPVGNKFDTVDFVFPPFDWNSLLGSLPGLSPTGGMCGCDCEDTLFEIDGGVYDQLEETLNGFFKTATDKVKTQILLSMPEQYAYALNAYNIKQFAPTSRMY